MRERNVRGPTLSLRISRSQSTRCASVRVVVPGVFLSMWLPARECGSTFGRGEGGAARHSGTCVFRVDPESRDSGFDAEPVIGPRLHGPVGIAPEWRGGALAASRSGP